MTTSNKIFNQLQQLYKENPQGLNIVEEQIDLELQMNYFKRSAMLKKQVVTLDEVIEKVPLLYDPETRLEEKRDILVLLASFEEVEAFRVIEKFKEDATGEIKLWAAMAYRECKMLLESSLLNEDKILISTGLGGKGLKLRYFVCLLHKNKEDFNEVQERIVRGEFESSIEKFNSESESIVFYNNIMKAYILVPIDVPVKDIIDQIYNASIDFGDFLDEHTIVTNVRALTDDEIEKIVSGELREEDVLSDEDIPYFEVEDMDDDDDDDDFDDDDENDDEGDDDTGGGDDDDDDDDDDEGDDDIDDEGDDDIF